MRDLAEKLAKVFDIAMIAENQRVWFFRTNGGTYYYDYCLNNFIGLGWDKVDKELILSDISQERKKEMIQDIYPDEKRPGLILGQLNTFYHKMQVGDLVLIPSDGGKEVTIGIIGSLIDEVLHVAQENEYLQCDYLHKRRVDWIKKVDLYQDVYLFRALRGQQTISNITDCADLVLRNLYPAYIANNSLHFTLKKVSTEDFSLHTNVALSSSILKIAEIVSQLYQGENFKDSIKVKTAVGSPGFIEIITELIPEAVIAVGVIFNFIVGKIKSDGSANGLLGVFSSINTLVNDHKTRKKTDAEIALLEIQAKREEAEIEHTKAETEKLKIETKLLANELSQEEEAIKLMQYECDVILSESISAGIVCEFKPMENTKNE